RSQEALRAISAQTYPSGLMETIEVQYVPVAPGAHTSALNAAWESATGEFVVHAESGVVWDGTKVERQVRQLQEDPSLSACVHCMTACASNGRARLLDLRPLETYGLLIGCLLDVPWGPGAAVFRKEAMAELGVYRNVDQVLWEYAVRLAEKGHPVELTDEDLAVWHVDEGPVHEGQGLDLAPSRVRHSFMKSYLDRMTPEALFPGSGRQELGQLVLAGLHHRNDDLAAAHALCTLAGRDTGLPEASYWHGMTHRREGDFQGARRWFRGTTRLEVLSGIRESTVGLLQRVMQMPEYGSAREAALRLMQQLNAEGTWDPNHLVGLCETCLEGGTPEERRLLEEVQEIEFCVVFDRSFELASQG
ncbi:MAG: hypothetical protein QGI83_17435, partial [Candidatus Latescibacteria bacterium]|nr:hypothetical protein [Candidatus Latescibacterota bacterium]